MICPNCKADNLFEDARFCPSCGAEISSLPNGPSEEQNSRAESTEEPLDFVVTETADTGIPELIGTEKTESKPDSEPAEELELKSPAGLMENSAVPSAEPNGPNELDFSGINSEQNEQPPQKIESRSEESDELVTQDNFIPTADYSSPEPEQTNSPEPQNFGDSYESTAPPKTPKSSEEPPRPEYEQPQPVSDIPQWEDPPALKNKLEQNPEPPGEAPQKPADLSATQPPSGFTRSFPGGDKQPDKQEPEQTPEPALAAFPEQPAPEEDTNRIKPIADPSEQPVEVKKASRARGIAWFWGNYIKLVGNAYLHENDELAAGKKEYLLKPYRLSKKAKMYGAGAAFVVVLLIVGSFFVHPTVGSDGKIVGMVLNQYSQPYVGGARVTISELNKSTTSNTQGFFQFEEVPTGTYQFIFEVKGKVIGKGNATVVAGQETLMTFGNLNPDYAGADEISYAPEEESSEPERPAAKQKDSGKSTSSSKSSKSKYGAIKLAANVDNAKVVVDGKTLGAGNNTYNRINPGQHKVIISKDGYTEYTEVVKVRSGRTATVKANLSPRAVEPTELTAYDYNSRGEGEYASGEYKKAVASFTRAIELDPSSLQAYQNRARAYAQQGIYDKAASDYIRGGEIYRIQGNPEEAVSLFSNALDMDSDNKLALVGRAGARIDKSQYRSARMDYEKALELDDDFYPALLGVGICEYTLGKTKNAEKYFRKAQKANPNDPYVYQYMMLNYFARDDVKKLRRAWSDYKDIASPQDISYVKESPQFQPVLSLIKPEDL